MTDWDALAQSNALSQQRPDAHGFTLLFQGIKVKNFVRQTHRSLPAVSRRSKNLGAPRFRICMEVCNRLLEPLLKRAFRGVESTVPESSRSVMPLKAAELLHSMRVVDRL
jgi:hypothetical protein